MAPDNSATIPVLDCRRRRMVLQWHALGDRTACDNPPPLVHGPVLIRVSQPNSVSHGHGGFATAIGPEPDALAENWPRST
jgi:hypothetical protein